MGPLASAWNWNQILEPVMSYPFRVLGTSMTRRYQTASVGALERGLASGQLESSSEGDSPCGTSPAWKCHSPTGRELSISRVWSFAIAAGERFFCSRMGVKDWAKAMEDVSANASGKCLRCMAARLANSSAIEKFNAGEI